MSKRPVERSSTDSGVADASRRRFLQKSLLTAAVVAAGAVAAPGPAAAKLKKKTVNYKDEPEGDNNCANCKHFVADNACKKVDGAISPNGWCSLWSKMKT